ncbi:hypothetical protein [Promicromonospora sp. MEB111]|uniref:hypothetical protein n=1 Tax=unclassified Promicromonospora TaxID=2647929 RepID=UPI00254B4E9A|nr:hypothetical protein [Promicromonospora sp. MEB111]
MAGRILELDAKQWAAVTAEARDGGGATAVGTALAEHLGAPVRATFISTSGSNGTVTRLTMIGDRVLLVIQVIAERDGETFLAPGAELRFATADELWPALTAALPPFEALRAPASAVPGPAQGSEPGTGPVADRAELIRLLDDEQANLQVSVEAWGTSDAPQVVWPRLWSVVDGKLLDVRTDDGAPAPVERPAGSVAAELQWALVGAVDATTPAAGTGTDAEGEAGR